MRSFTLAEPCFHFSLRYTNLAHRLGLSKDILKYLCAWNSQGKISSWFLGTQKKEEEKEN